MKNAKRSSLASLFCCAGAALALAAFAPQNAHAVAAPGTAANAKILNIVTVTYFDATGANEHKAATSTSILVALKPAPLTVATQVPFVNVDSGATATTYVALTSNANGSDTYKLSTFTNSAAYLTAGNTITANITTDSSGANPTAISSGGTFTLGATSIVSVTTSGSDQVLSIPAGALNGISTSSIVVIGTTSYKVTAVTAGTVPSYQTGPQTGIDSNPTTETLGSITISKDTTPGGSNVDPSLATGTSLAGTIIAERKFLKITDTAVVSSNTDDGTDTFTIDTNTNVGNNTASLSPSPVATFYHVSLSINKTVTNISDGTLNTLGKGKPGDILEYTVTVSNSTNGNAGKVSIQDAVPAYTTLVSGSGAYGSGGGTGTATDKFATIYDGSTTVDITLGSGDAESNTVGCGSTENNAIVAGKKINFYLGTGANATTGGTVAPAKTYTIKYQVKID